MTKPINFKIQICCGTMCYIMGGASLHSLKETLPAEIKDSVSIEGIPCMGLCNQPDAEHQHPCVLINGEIIKNASNHKIVKQLLNHTEL